MTAPRFHFIDDYRKLVKDLIDRFPLPEAMSRAVGGSFDALGEVEKQLLVSCGLGPSHTLVDVGCGSGRLAKALAPLHPQGGYLGTDVVPELLEYARTGCPPHWRFEVVEGLRIPAPENSADFACFFSVFTHLLHEETYCYLVEARRVVRRGGRIVFSFLEYEHNWAIFESTYANIAAGRGNVHLNTFIGRDAIAAWSEHLGMAVVEIHGANDRFIPLTRPISYDDGATSEGFAALGQSVCVLSNDKPPSAGIGGEWRGLNPYGRQVLVR